MFKCINYPTPVTAWSAWTSSRKVTVCRESVGRGCLGPGPWCWLTLGQLPPVQWVVCWCEQCSRWLYQQPSFDINTYQVKIEISMRNFRTLFVWNKFYLSNSHYLGNNFFEINVNDYKNDHLFIMKDIK